MHGRICTERTRQTQHTQARVGGTTKCYGSERDQIDPRVKSDSKGGIYVLAIDGHVPPAMYSIKKWLKLGMRYLLNQSDSPDATH